MPHSPPHSRQRSPRVVGPKTIAEALHHIEDTISLPEGDEPPCLLPTDYLKLIRTFLFEPAPEGLNIIEQQRAIINLYFYFKFKLNKDSHDEELECAFSDYLFSTVKYLHLTPFKSELLETIEDRQQLCNFYEGLVEDFPKLLKDFDTKIQQQYHEITYDLYINVAAFFGTAERLPIEGSRIGNLGDYFAEDDVKENYYELSLAYYFKALELGIANPRNLQDITKALNLFSAQLESLLDAFPKIEAKDLILPPNAPIVFRREELAEKYATTIQHLAASLDTYMEDLSISDSEAVSESVMFTQLNETSKICEGILMTLRVEREVDNKRECSPHKESPGANHQAKKQYTQPEPDSPARFNPYDGRGKHLPTRSPTRCQSSAKMDVLKVPPPMLPGTETSITTTYVTEPKPQPRQSTTVFFQPPNEKTLPQQLCLPLNEAEKKQLAIELQLKGSCEEGQNKILLRYIQQGKDIPPGRILIEVNNSDDTQKSHVILVPRNNETSDAYTAYLYTPQGRKITRAYKDVALVRDNDTLCLVSKTQEQQEIVALTRALNPPGLPDFPSMAKNLTKASIS